MRFACAYLVALVACACARADVLPFPTDVASAAHPVAELLEASRALNPTIGRYPPALPDDEHREQAYAQWKGLLAEARLAHTRDGDTESTFLLLGRLLRQGNNLDVDRAGEEAMTVFDAALKKFPDSDPLNLEASFFYLSVDPKFAPRGEAALQKLRALRHTDRDPEVERGFIFAYLYQDRIADAKQQVERCLELTPNDATLRQLQAALKRQPKVERVTMKDGVKPGAK